MLTMPSDGMGSVLASTSIRHTPAGLDAEHTATLGAGVDQPESRPTGPRRVPATVQRR